MSETALITGAATGIGAATAKLLADRGLRVAVCDVNEHAGRATAEAVGGEFFPCDVSRLESVNEAFDLCAQRLGTPSYVHLNAGIMTVPANEDPLPIEAVDEDRYRRIVGVNLDGVYNGLKVALPVLRTGGGAVTITASIAGLGAVPGDPLYTATKYAVIGLARAVAGANAQSSVRINVICPGVVDTAIVPDAYRAPQFGVMPAEVMAAEAVDLLLQGANGEVRVKRYVEQPAYAVDPVPLRELEEDG